MFDPPKSSLSILKTAQAIGLSFESINNKATLLCPFHSEDSPSFGLIESGEDDIGYYHCFGCQVSGDVFSLVQKIKGFSFPEAKKFVYSIHGFCLPDNEQAALDEIEKFNRNSPAKETAAQILSPSEPLAIIKSTLSTLGYKNYIPKEMESLDSLSSFISNKIKGATLVDWKQEACNFYGHYANDTLIWYLDEPYMRRDNIWIKLNSNELARLSCDYLEYRFGEKWVTRTKNQDMIYFIKTYARKIPDNNSFIFSTYLNDNTITAILLKNKIFTLSLDGNIELFDPKKNVFFSTTQWNVNYTSDDTVSAPVFQKYLQRVQPKIENQILLMELMGYMLVPDNRLQKFFILKGEGKNGKSVFLSILKDMIGNGNYTSLSLDQLEKSYALSALIGKTANICADMGEIDKAAEGLLKSITSGDQITCDRKYLSAATFLPTAKHVFSTNNIPRFSDKSEGLWRRMIIIPFDEILSDEEIDVTITEKLKEEIDQIFLFAVEGLKRIIKNGWKFSIPDNIKNTLNEERDNASTLRQFVNENCTLSPDDNVEIKTFYQSYCNWTNSNGQKPSSKNSIGRELARFGVKSKVFSYGKNSIRKYEGILLKE